MKYTYYSMCILCFCLSCKQTDPPDENFNAADSFNRTIEVNTFHVYNILTPADSLLPGVQVEIYSNRQNFQERIYADATRVTDSVGYCVFENRNKEYYWIIAEHAAFGLITDSVSTPENTTSFVPLLFY